MEILNDLPEDELLALDGFLAFLGVYEDEGRLEAFARGLSRLGVTGGVVVEAGAGLGRLSGVILETVRPDRLILVEENPYALSVLHRRFGGRKDVEVVPGLVEDFHPPVTVDLLVQELFGPLLYDESLAALERLRFRPRRIFPDRGFLKAQVVPFESLGEEVLDPATFRELAGALVSDLFPDFEAWEPQRTVLEWRAFQGLRKGEMDLADLPGDVVVFGVEVWDGEEKLCDPVRCPNWPFVFTPRVGDRFDLSFAYLGGLSRTEFRWTD